MERYQCCFYLWLQIFRKDWCVCVFQPNLVYTIVCFGSVLALSLSRILFNFERAHNSTTLRNGQLLIRKNNFFKTWGNMLYQLYYVYSKFNFQQKKWILISQAKLRGHSKFPLLFNMHTFNFDVLLDWTEARYFRSRILSNCLVYWFLAGFLIVCYLFWNKLNHHIKLTTM